MDSKDQTAQQSLGNIAKGRYGEALAARYLVELGMTILARNWRGRTGELDIVAIDRDVLVICEVKTRSSQRFGGPLAAITATKLARLRGLAGEWIAANPMRVSGVRIDIVAVVTPPRGRAQVEHLVGVQ